MLTFRIRNTRLHLSIWFFAILYLFLIMDRQQFYPLFFGSIFLHEAAHLIIMIWWKKKILSISLLPFGIRVSAEETVIQSYGQEFLLPWLARWPILSVPLSVYGAYHFTKVCRWLYPQQSI